MKIRSSLSIQWLANHRRWLSLQFNAQMCIEHEWTRERERERLFSFVHVIDREKEWPSIVNLFVDSFHLRSERNERWYISTIHSFRYFSIKVKQQNNKRIHWSNEENSPIGIDISPSMQVENKTTISFVGIEFLLLFFFFFFSVFALYSPVTMTC